ncbi:glycosyltransferase [Gelidibacter sp.]|uniref:glycosyltransferase n=1 Tax=Gelidibacter sp. TaxID=2018083 RepID=UPI003267CD77
MRLSIIIPVYNVEKYVSQCLDSVLDQDIDAKDYEIIIVNDGSTDGSLRIIQNYAKIHDRIKVIDKKNGGVGSARNCGMDVAQGKYIYFLDPDDYLISNSLKALVDTSERHHLDILTFLSGFFSKSSPKNQTIANNLPLDISVEHPISPITTGEDYLENEYYRVEVWYFFINREFLKNSEIRFIEGRWMEDAIFSLELFLKAKRMTHLKFDAHRHRKTSGTAMTKREPTHYLNVIRDIQNVAIIYDSKIKMLENKNINPGSLARIKAKQESFVFFSMIRILQSTMSFEEVKRRMSDMSLINAYPINSFLGKDYNRIDYKILVPLFNKKWRFYFFFRLVNPVLKLKYKF